MGRRRSKNLHFPPRMQKRGRVYYYTPYVDGRLRWIRLSDSYPTAMAMWAEFEGGMVSSSTVGHALDRYLVQVLPQKAAATQREYRRYSGRLRLVFGDTPLDRVRPTHSAQYLDQHRAPALAKPRSRNALERISASSPMGLDRQ